MDNEYNNLKILIDVLTFKLRIKNIKKFKKMSKLWYKIKNHKASVSDLVSISKYNPKEIIDLIKFHNKYVIGEDNKISIEELLTNLFINSTKFKETISYNKIPIFDIIKNVESILGKK